MPSNLENKRGSGLGASRPRTTRGFTMIELVVVIGILTLVAGVYFYVWKQQGRLSANDQEVAAYYMSAAIFMDVFYSDTRMARKIEPTTEGCIMEVMRSGGLEQVTYTLRGDSIERLAGGKTRAYTFGKPLHDGATVLFKIVELTP